MVYNFKVEHQLIEVRQGKSPEYLNKLQELQDNMKSRIEVAGILRQLRLANIRNKFEAEEQVRILFFCSFQQRKSNSLIKSLCKLTCFKHPSQAALQNLESEKALAWDYHHNELQETIKRLEEDRHNVEINWGEGGEWGSRSRSRSRRKAVTVSGPYIVYMLRPQDIMEDWTLIRKALKRSP